MTCERVSIDGATAFVCGPRRRRPRCACGREAALECDWKVPARKTGTCDAAICDRCTVSPAPGKDLCPTHAVEFEAWKARRA